MPSDQRQFKLIYIFWAMAVVAASLATFGSAGIWFAIAVLVFWFAIGLVVAGKVLGETLVISGLVIGFLSLLFPAITNSHGPQHINNCGNNLRQIQLAILNYESANGRLPPPYIEDEDGTLMHSWRVLILPYVEEQALHDRYNFSEPWNSQDNLKLLDELPDVFRCPCREDDLCHYLAVTGKDSAWRANEPVRLGEITRGSSKCVTVAESLKGVPWTKPEDITPGEFLKTAIERGQSNSDGGHATREDGAITGQWLHLAYADGHIRRIQVPQQAHWLEKLAQRSGEFEPDSLQTKYFEPKPVPKTSIPGWTLLVLCMLPVTPMTKWYFSRKKRPNRETETAARAEPSA